MKLNQIEHISMLAICMWAVLAAAGGFFDDTAAFAGILIVICLLAMLIQRKPFYKRDRRSVFKIPFILFCIAVMVSLWSVDYMENLMGVMRIGVLCLWISLVRSREKKEAEKVKDMLPAMGCVTFLLSLGWYYVKKKYKLNVNFFRTSVLKLP